MRFLLDMEVVLNVLIHFIVYLRDEGEKEGELLVLREDVEVALVFFYDKLAIEFLG